METPQWAHISFTTGGKGSRSITWDVAVAKGVGEVAKLATSKKVSKYSDIVRTYIFQPLVVENLDRCDVEMLSELGKNSVSVC